MAQRTAIHAARYITQNALGITATKVNVATYVANTSNPAPLRLGLLRAWNNRAPSPNRIATPPDLVPTGTTMTTTADLSGWKSEDEDALDLPETIESKAREKGTLERSDKNKSPERNVPHLDLFDAIRLGRQVVKRDQYSHLPFTTEIGGHRFELNRPGTKDIYVTPLKAVTGKPSTYKRTGAASDFNYRNLVARLRKQFPKAADQEERALHVLEFYLKKQSTEITPEIAELLGAISADFMKGSSGARHFLLKAIHRLKRQRASSKTTSFDDVFLGAEPLYLPATTGGRGKVVRMTVRMTPYEREVNYLLGHNNCLINAISQAARGHNANLGELLHIRERLNNVGEMMVANATTIEVIREALGISNNITVRYLLPTNKEIFPAAPNSGPDISVFHTGVDHFTNVCLDASKYDMT